ncbi:MAG: endonuclease Q family protein [Patescibacteria group bacterium]
MRSKTSPRLASGRGFLVYNERMRFFADLEIHSRFARACSPDLTIPNIALWAAKKGIGVIGTGDFTHPQWMKEIKETLEPAETGLYKLKSSPSTVRFLLSGEVSCIYSKGGRVRRVHHLVYAPSIEIAENCNAKLSAVGNIRSDGRPIIGITSKRLLELLLSASPECVLIPAHVWTPHFGVFGSASGYDSLKECFEEREPQVFAIETGLSSNPAMNWRIPFLDNKAIISSSDAHSLHRIGREATIFDTDLSYKEIFDALRARDSRLAGTIEFFPEEGKYHYDGHRDCKVSWSPKETKRNKGLCSVCKRKVTVGVMARVEQLAAPDRPEGWRPAGAKPYFSLVPLEELIAEALALGVASKAVRQMYEETIKKLGEELKILLDVPERELRDNLSERVAEAIVRVRQGKLHIEPGYDGEYGKIKIFDESERAKGAAAQTSLF